MPGRIHKNTLEKLVELLSTLVTALVSSASSTGPGTQYTVLGLLICIIAVIVCLYVVANRAE